MNRLVIWIFWLFVIILLLYSLFFGSLLFMNPIKLGLRSQRLDNATIYTSNIYELNPIYQFVDEQMIAAEAMYQLSYKERVNIYVSTSTNEFRRWAPPWIGNGVGGVSLYIGNAIFINPEKIKEHKYVEEEFLKHELIHNLIRQNSAIGNNFVFDSQEWMSEGMAMYFGGPNYMNENEFRTQIRNKKLIYDEKTLKLFTSLEDDYKLRMTVYNYFITFLIREYGNSSFLTYMKQYIEAPNNSKIIFYEVYNKPLKLIFDEFKKEYGAK